MVNSETSVGERSIWHRSSLVFFAGFAAASVAWTIWAYLELGEWLTYTGGENWGWLAAYSYCVPLIPVQGAMAAMAVFVIIRKRRAKLRWVFATAGVAHMVAFLAMFYLTYKLLAS